MSDNSSKPLETASSMRINMVEVIRAEVSVLRMEIMAKFRSKAE